MAKEQLLKPGATALKILYWGAVWCGPCKIIKPSLKWVEENRDDVEIVHLDIDKHQSLASEFYIRGVPTLHIVKEGRVVDTLVGAVPAMDIVRALDKASA